MGRKTKNHRHGIAAEKKSQRRKCTHTRGGGEDEGVWDVCGGALFVWGWLWWRCGCERVIASVHLGCLVWQQAKLRDKRDDRVTHSRRMGKPTAPLTLYFSGTGREEGREGGSEGEGEGRTPHSECPPTSAPRVNHCARPPSRSLRTGGRSSPAAKPTDGSE